jgi:hypothetical protein
MSHIPNDTSAPSCKPPDCCGTPMVLVGQGHAGNCDIGLWRCLTCEDHTHTNLRTDGENFWVGAMAVAIHRETVRIVARAYRDPTRAR